MGATRCASVRVMVFANKAMASRAAMEAEANKWLAAAGVTPPGNGADAAAWGAGAPGGAVAVMTPAERASYEDKKLKMRRAMGDTAVSAGDEDTAAVDGDARRANMRAAMERDDWSAVIEGQTREAVGDADGAVASPRSSGSDYVVSPFTRSDVHRAVGANTPARELSIAAVDAALNEVRPYLIADGGNVEVLSVSDGVVSLRLQGACGTCSSSAATMKMGIERALRSAFGDALKEVLQVPAPGAAGGGPTDVAAIRALLNDTVGAAIRGMGGLVEVRSLERGVCVLGFRGPLPLGKGIAAAVRDKFPDVRDVKLEDM